MKIIAILATVLGLGGFWGTRSVMLPSPSQAVNLNASSPSADASKRAEKSSAQRRPTRDEIFNAVDEDRLVLLVRWLATATAGEVAEMAAALEQTKRLQQGLWAAVAERWVEVAPEPAVLFARALSVAELDGPDGASWRNSAITIKSVEVYNYKKLQKIR